MQFERCDGCRARLRSFGPANTQNSATWLLPCLHALCTLCKAKCMQGDPQQRRLVCHLCRTECSREQALALPVSKDCVAQCCETAACPDKQLATMRCVNCNELLCEACSQAHRRVTATSGHTLQMVGSISADHAVCVTHSRKRLTVFCSCGSMLCKDCVISQTHEGPMHIKTPVMQLAPASHIDEAKIVSSTARETVHIDCSLSMIQVRKSALDDCVNNLKKEVGNHVVQICQAVMRRGNDLLRSLDLVKNFKSYEYDKLRGELMWQKMRFERINAYVAEVKNYEDPVALVMTKQFLENCIRVIKTKKVNNEGSLNGLQRPPQVQFKPNTDYVLGVLHQWGRVLADLYEAGTLKPVEMSPTPPTSNLLDVPLFDIGKNGVRAPCQFNAVPSTSMPQTRQMAPTMPGAMRPGAPPPRYPMSIRLTPEQMLMYQRQQQMRAAQDMAVRQSQPSPQSINKAPPGNDPRYTAIRQMRAPNMHSNVQYRFPAAAYCYRGPTPPTSSFDARFASGSQYMLPNGATATYPAPQMVSPNVPLSSISSPIPATNLMEALNNVQSFPATSIASSSVIRGGEPTLVIQEAAPNGAQEVTMEEERKKIIAQEMEEARRRREAAQLGERIGQTEAPTSSVDCIARTVVAQQSDITSTTQRPSVEPSSSQVSSSTSNGTPPPKDPAPAAPRTPLKVTIRRCSTGSVATALVNDPEQVASITDMSGDSTDESKWDDYCYVCQQGCDEKTGSLGCCARCPRVYHNCCHIPSIKQPMESLPDEWACSLCMPAEPLHEDSGVMGHRERLLCSKVLLRCYENFPQAEPFSHPVARTVPNYYVIIKHPMDFGTIARRLRERAKDAFVNVIQFVQCMNLVFENCSTFNPPDDEVAQAGRSVYNLYSKAVKEFLPCMKSCVWLYINKYSEGRNNMLVQKDSSGQLRPHSDESSSEPHAKKPRKEIKNEVE
uniref:Transcription intermediary factor 1-alpha n=2 Tax=Ascaris suum TaxID=6253 RepID=F1KU59_ASCSU